MLALTPPRYTTAVGSPGKWLAWEDGWIALLMCFAIATVIALREAETPGRFWRGVPF